MSTDAITNNPEYNIPGAMPPPTVHLTPSLHKSSN